MSAEEIAKVVADVRGDRYQIPPNYNGDMNDHITRMHALTRAVVGDSERGPIVDATAVYHSLVESGRPVHVYEDHPNIAPPWRDSTICYRNEHGNVIVMVNGSYETDEIKNIDAEDNWRAGLGDHWEPAEPVDWDRVKWLSDTVLWIGGRGARGPFPTTGPAHMWRFAIYDDGAPADLHWIQLVPEYPMAHWDMAHLVILGTLNFMNCRNVELVEPSRPRAEIKRIARTGLRVSEMSVFPVGRSRRGAGPIRSHGVPLTSVRGHFAHYGACCAHHEPRGRLFGKLTGRYWIPQHGRGSSGFGEIEHQDITLREAQ